MVELSEEERWLSREEELLNDIEDRIRFFNIWCERNRYGQRISSLVVLVCSVLAPIVVALEPSLDIAAIKSGENSINLLALLLTTIVALAEGIRRIFRFDSRWSICADGREKLRGLRAEYLDNQIGNATGSRDWASNVSATRRVFASVWAEHTADFAQMLAARKKEPARSDRSTGASGTNVD